MNGTYLIVRACLQYNIQVEIVKGLRRRCDVLLPHINLTCPDTRALSIPFVRLQYPLRLAFALTSHRSQGQSFDRVGILFHDLVFANRQLYISLFRATPMVFESSLVSMPREIWMKPPIHLTLFGHR